MKRYKLDMNKVNRLGEPGEKYNLTIDTFGAANDWQAQRIAAAILTAEYANNSLNGDYLATLCYEEDEDSDFIVTFSVEGSGALKT